MTQRENNFTGHVAVVAGGSGGIGTCVCRMLLERGATVVSIRHRSRQPALISTGIVKLQADLRSYHEWSRVIRAIVRRFGTTLRVPAPSCSAQGFPVAGITPH